MYTRRWLAIAILAAGLAPAQQAPASLRVTGAVQHELTLTADDLAKLPRATAKFSNHGRESTYQGVPLHEVLGRAGVPHGKDLRGRALATYVLAQAQDGYRVVFSLAELDPYFIDNEVLLADTVDGKPLSRTEAPFRIIVPHDKPGARCIRMLTKLEVVQVAQ